MHKHTHTHTHMQSRLDGRSDIWSVGVLLYQMDTLLVDAPFDPVDIRNGKGWGVLCCVCVVLLLLTTVWRVCVCVCVCLSV